MSPERYNIPPATLAAGDQSDPAWWLACAAWHEAEAAAWTRQPANGIRAAHHSAAALACRTFAAMMERGRKTAARATSNPRWYVTRDGCVLWMSGLTVEPLPLPAAAVAALTEE